MSKPALTLTALALACALPASHAQGGWSATASTSAVFQGKADFEGSSGSFKADSANLRAGLSTALGPSLRAGVALNAESIRYRFDGLASAPWGDVERYGISAPLSLALSGGWTALLTPSVDVMREKGAASRDALVWGATAAGMKSFAADRHLGLGLALFRRFDDTVAFPLLVVDWNLGQGWTLANPLAAGPTGPAGLELRYQLAPRWEAGFGGAYRSIAFRLDESRPGRVGAVGIESGLPLFVRATYAVTPELALDVVAGALTYGRLEIQTAGGDKLSQRDLGNSALAAIALRGRF